MRYQDFCVSKLVNVWAQCRSTDLSHKGQEQEATKEVKGCLYLVYLISATFNQQADKSTGDKMQAMNRMLLQRPPHRHWTEL